jgi:hypothetical protein
MPSPTSLRTLSLGASELVTVTWTATITCGMGEKPRTTDAGPASTSETTETRTEKTEFRTSSDTRTSTSAHDEDARDQAQEAGDDQRDRGDEDVRDQAEEAGDDRGDAPEGSSLGSKLGSKLGLGHHGDRADRDDTE